MSSAGIQGYGEDRAPAYSPVDPGASAVEDRTENPPVYSGHHGRREPRRLTSSAQQTVEHSFTSSKDSKSTSQLPWLSLRLHSYAGTTESTPIVLEGKPVNGVVELDLDKPDDIKDITVTVSKTFICVYASRSTLTHFMSSSRE